MDFEGAILAHSRWKRRLQAGMTGGEPLDTAVVARNDQCDLGRWLQGEGKTHASVPEFGRLVQAHTAFHTCAATVAARINRGDTAGANQMLSLQGEFTQASSAVVQAIAGLRDHVARLSGAASKG